MFQKLKNCCHFFQAFVSAAFFGFPSKKLIVIGVTGTDGKTTTASMIYEILKYAKHKPSLVTSVNAQIGLKTFDTGFHVTTPSPWQVQKYLKKAVGLGSSHFIIEATSHGLDQNRLAFIDFKVAAITNITQEHLDYHKTWRAYVNAKAKLFKNARFSILNIDDKSFDILKSAAGGKIITYGRTSKADFNPKNIPLKLKIVGAYNLSNALAAAACASSLKISKSTITHSLNSFQGIKGRMEKLDLGQKFDVFIDFAHTPNALENALKALKSQIKDPRSKVIAVFGSAGKRDKSKRKPMGEVAAKNADVTILTAEDPRTENVGDITNQIAQGLIKNGKKEGKDFYQVLDRTKAIQFATNLAKEGDIVGFFGKGHEKSMCFGKKEFPWDERAQVEKALKGRQNGKS